MEGAPVGFHCSYNPLVKEVPVQPSDENITVYFLMIRFAYGLVRNRWQAIPTK